MNGASVDMVQPREAGALTSRQAEVLVEYVEHGSSKAAAACLGMPDQRIRRVLHEAHVRTATTSTVGLLRAVGWLRVPVRHA